MAALCTQAQAQAVRSAGHQGLGQKQTRPAVVGGVRCVAAPASECSTIGVRLALSSRSQKRRIPRRLGHVRAADQVSEPARPAVERSYIMIKPDGVQRALVGDIISRFERKGFTLKGLKLYECPEGLAKEHYRDLRSKPFFAKLVAYILSGPIVAMVWEGNGVVAASRKIIGATNPLAAEPGTIRGDFAIEVGRNVIHGSDSPENAEREIDLWFNHQEVIAWRPSLTPWLRE